MQRYFSLMNVNDGLGTATSCDHSSWLKESIFGKPSKMVTNVRLVQEARMNNTVQFSALT